MKVSDGKSKPVPMRLQLSTECLKLQKEELVPVNRNVNQKASPTDSRVINPLKTPPPSRPFLRFFAPETLNFKYFIPVSSSKSSLRFLAVAVSELRAFARHQGSALPFSHSARKRA